MFDWETENIDHVAEHGVTPQEAEEAVTDPRRVRAPAYGTATEQRRAYLGASAAGRVLYVVITRRDGRFRVITARDADRQEKRRYREKGQMMAGSMRQLIPVEREDIPIFSNEEEEHRFWSTHSLGPGLLAEMQPVPKEGDEWGPPARSKTRGVLIRFNDDVIARAKALAAQRHVPYQTMLKEFMSERLYEEEKRAGLR